MTLLPDLTRLRASLRTPHPPRAAACRPAGRMARHRAGVLLLAAGLALAGPLPAVAQADSGGFGSSGAAADHASDRASDRADDRATDRADDHAGDGAPEAAQGHGDPDDGDGAAGPDDASVTHDDGIETTPDDSGDPSDRSGSADGDGAGAPDGDGAGAGDGATAALGPDPTPEVGLIEAPSDAPGVGFDGAFSLVPERAEAPRAARKARAPQGSPPVVVEIFTAQGCSACPPADALVGALADRADVLTLSWHIDYWDYLGWPDDLARPGHARRQEGYAEAAGERGVYTPQIIVDGQDTLLGVSRAALAQLIGDHAARPPAVMVTAAPAGAGGFAVDLTPRAAIPGGVEVALIRFVPERTARITAGENGGRAITYRNVVLGAETLSRWPARAPLRLTVRAGDRGGKGAGAYPADTRHAILIQQIMPGNRPGPILAAIRLD